MTHKIPAGTTEAQDFTILAGGVAADLTGATLVGLQATSQRAPKTLGGVVAIVNASTGKVRYTPVAADFANEAVFSIRWKFTTGGKTWYAPNVEHPDTWRVLHP